jgi:hypothetical protein
MRHDTIQYFKSEKHDNIYITNKDNIEYLKIYNIPDFLNDNTYIMKKDNILYNKKRTFNIPKKTNYSIQYFKNYKSTTKVIKSIARLLILHAKPCRIKFLTSAGNSLLPLAQ